MAAAILTAEDIRGIQHQMVERRKARKAVRAQWRIEKDQERQFRAMVRGMREELGGLGHTADVELPDEDEE